MLQKFIDDLNREEPNLDVARRMWDKRAQEFSRFSVSEEDITMRMIEERMELAGAKVLDVGFGAGRYLISLLERGASVSGVELSENMRSASLEALNAKELDYDPEELIVSSWEELDLGERGWERAFDLVFLSMSPAISSFTALEKVLAATRRSVFLSAHIQRYDSLSAELRREMEIPERKTYFEKLYTIYNILYQMGYYPDIKFKASETVSHYATDEIIDRYTSWILGSEYNDAQVEDLTARMRSKEVDGKISITSKDVNGYLFVDTTMKR